MRETCAIGCSAVMLLGLAGAWAGCAHTRASGEQGAAIASKQDLQKLHQLFEEYFEAQLELNPVMATMIGDNRYNDRFENAIGPAWIARSEALDRRFLEKIKGVDPTSLRAQDRLSYDVFKLRLEQSLEGRQYQGELLPVNQMFSLPIFFVQLGSGTNMQPFKTVQDYDNWLGRLNGFAAWMEQAVANLRIGMDKGIVQPRVVAEKVLPQLAAHIVEDVEDSLFFMPIKNLPQSFPEADRKRLTETYRAAVADKVVASYKRLHDFIRDEYMPATRETVGWSALPNGQNWYNFLVRRTTSTDLTADEIHAIGLQEVARIRSEMQSIKRTMGFDGTLAEWFAYVQKEDRFYFATEKDLLDGYRALEHQVNAAVGKVFSIRPKAGFEVRAVESFRARSFAGAAYQSPTPDGSRPGIFYVNTFNLRAHPKFGMETLFFHEAIPGHHFQIALQQEVESLPRFRRFGHNTAFAEGWAHYAESIGSEFGFFTDPMQKYGRLNDEMLRAARLVVDTGLHSKGWTREQAITYMGDNTSMADSAIVAEVERYIAVPSQALAYKIGQLVISRLRSKAEVELGGGFDVKDFHREVLIDGPLPLPVLEVKLQRWIEEQKAPQVGAG